MVDAPTQATYRRVASAFALRIRTMFSTEAALEEAWKRVFSTRIFDRTAHWNVLLHRELVDVWKTYGPVVRANPTPFDASWILWFLSLELDYNLFTQVLLNLQPPGAIRYNNSEAEATLTALREKWASRKPSPFDAKPKMLKNAVKTEELEYNQDLSTLKALRIITGLTDARSFRVSPIGATPALTDSENLSMLGRGGDKFLVVPTGCRVFYFSWDQTPDSIESHDDDPSRLFVPGIPYPFISKSGGEILGEVLFARFLACLIFTNIAPGKIKAVLPRMHSVLLVTDASEEEMFDVRETVAGATGSLVTIQEGQRGEASGN